MRLANIVALACTTLRNASAMIDGGQCKRIMHGSGAAFRDPRIEPVKALKQTDAKGRCLLWPG
jgi:hypothetical protein